MDVATTDTDARFCRSKRGEIEPQGLRGRFQRAKRRRLPLHLIHKRVRLGGKVTVLVRYRSFTPGPITVTLLPQAPAFTMHLDSNAAASCVERDDIFTGELKLVERIAHQNPVFAACSDVDRVLDLDTGDYLVRTITKHAVCRTDHTFNPIDRVSQRILDRASTHPMISIIRLRISGPQSVEWLARRHHHLSNKT